ncbi:MAG: TSUP family transporter [Gammaproteobacteria bacterium]|nr:TSUP family transporter [Gammaproteobacteria bacterium]
MFTSLPLHEIVISVAILAAAYTFRGVTGFGSGLIAIPLLTLFMPLTFVVPCINVLDVSASLVHGWRHREYTQWRELLPVLPFTAIGVIVAIYLLKSVHPALMVHALGGFILLFAVYSLIGPEFKQRCSRKWAGFAGSLGGMIGTMFGTGGPLYVIYFQMRGLPKSIFRSTIATLFLIDGGMRFTGYVGSGFYNRDMVLWIAVAFPVMALGLFIGGRIHTGITQRQFQRAIGVLLVISGIALLAK